MRGDDDDPIDAPGVLRLLARHGALGELSLQRPPMNAQDTSSLRSVATAVCQDPLNVLPLNARERMERGPRLTAASRAHPERMRLVTESTLLRLRDEVYRFWRALDNLPNFMQHLESVTAIGDRRPHWVAKAFRLGNRPLNWRIHRTPSFRYDQAWDTNKEPARMVGFEHTR